MSLQLRPPEAEAGVIQSDTSVPARGGGPGNAAPWAAAGKNWTWRIAYEERAGAAMQPRPDRVLSEGRAQVRGGGTGGL